MIGSAQNLSPSHPDPLPAGCGFNDALPSNETETFPSPKCAHSSIYWKTDLYFPPENASPIRIRANFYVIQKADGTGNFSENDPDDVAFLNDWFDKCNETFATLKVQKNDCSQTIYHGAKVEIIPNWIFVRDEYYWNNDNTRDAWKCPDTIRGRWHLHPYDLINYARDPGAINVYLTASGSIYHQMVTLGTITDPNNGIGGKMPYWWCSQYPYHPDSLLSSRIHIPNLYLKYWWFKNTYPEPFSTTRQWLVDEGRTLAHEFGHSLNLPHSASCVANNLMRQADGGYKDLLTEFQMKTVHRALALTSLRQFIPCEENYRTPASTRVVSNNETWDVNMRLFADVVVKRGATLTITCKILMPEEGVITVERGGKLIIDGGEVYRANTCGPNRYWRTIAAHGDPASQVNGATVRVIRGGLIEGAVVGVTTGGWPNNDASLWGATVQVDLGSFRDCRKGVEFWPFNQANGSYFRKASFLRTASGTSHTGVSMWQTRGILFENCAFTNMVRNGITSFDASYSVQKNCRFQGSSQSAIYSGATNLLPVPILIGNRADAEADRNVFSNNTIGVHLTAGNKVEIYRNRISSYDFDIAMTGQVRTIIHRNSFSAGAAGIRLQSTGIEVNDLQCNGYSGSQVGINIVGTNTGFSFKEDGFTTGIHDLFLENDGANMASIRDQGSSTEGRWNFFTAAHTQQIKTKEGQTQVFRYYYPNNMPRPRCGLEDNTCTPNSNFNTSFTPPLIPECHGGGPSDDEPPCDDDSCARPGLDSSIAVLRALLEQGSSADMLQAAHESTPTRLPSLLAASPYLSDAVLLAVAANAGFSTAQKTTLLQANAPLETGISALLPTWIDSVSVRQIAVAGLSRAFSERARAEDELNKLIVEKETAAQRFFARHAEQNNWNRLETVFSQDTGRSNRRRLFSVYLAQSKFGLAEQVLDQMPVADVEDLYFVQTQRINTAHRRDPVAYRLDSLSENTLLAIAASHTQAAGYAQSLLGLLTGREWMPDLPDLGSAAASRSRSDNPGPRTEPALTKQTGQQQQVLQIAPNPARETLQLHLSGSEGGRVEFCRLTTGRVERTVYLPDSTAVVLSVRELPQGVYVLTAFRAGRVVARQKLVIHP